MIDIIFNTEDIIYFLLILVRISAMVFVIPVFGAKYIPVQWRIAFSFILALTTYFIIPRPGGMDFDAAATGLILSAGREVIIGLLIGFTAGLIFSAVLLGGQVIGTQMGLGIANVMDPQHGTNMSIVSQFHFLLATVVFMAVNGHHLLLEGVVDAFRYLPAGDLSLPIGGMGEIARLAGIVFVIAVQLAASVIVMLLMVSVSLGIIARTVPQMNIFIVGFPLRLLVGLFGIGISIPYVTRALIDLFSRIPEDLVRVLGAV